MMKRALMILTFILIAMTASIAMAGNYEVRLHNRAFTPDAPLVISSQIQQFAGHHALVQLHETPNATMRKTLAENGIRLLRPINGRTWVALINNTSKGTNASAASVRWVGELLSTDKIQASVLAGKFLPHSELADGQRALLIGMHKDIAEAQGRNILESAGATVLDHSELLNTFIVSFAPSGIKTLAANDAIEWISEPSLALSPTLNLARPGIGADVAGEAPYSVTGQGVTAFILDGGTIATGNNTHPDLAGRVTKAGLPVPDFIGHPTHVGCIIGGDGTLSNGLYTGIAPDVNIITTSVIPQLSLPAMYDAPGNMEKAYKTAIEMGATVANNSIGSNLATFGDRFCDMEGDYEDTAMLVDEIARGAYGNITIVWANGNERGHADGPCGAAYNTTAPPATAKNPITVGATNKDDDSMTVFSSWGPTDDGRLRPDVSAPGCSTDMEIGITSCAAGIEGIGEDYIGMCGTSMACPVVTGAVALVQQYWREQISSTDAWASTIKALMIHGSTDVEDPGPDYRFGYGIIDVPTTLDLVDEAVIIEDQIDQGETFSVTLYPTTGQKKITLVWSDPAGGHLAEKVLVNDLDLSATVGNAIELPWIVDPANPADAATKGQNHRDNVEQVSFTYNEEGIIVVSVSATDVPQGPQPFSIVASGMSLEDPAADDDDDAAPISDSDDDEDDEGCGC